MLSQLNIYVELQYNLPVKVEYEYLRKELKNNEYYNRLAPNSMLLITGCTGFCPEGVQRQWCEHGGYKTIEDEEAGEMVVPELAIKYYIGRLPSIEELEGWGFYIRLGECFALLKRGGDAIN